MTTDDIQDIEIDLLLEGIYRRYGYDFRSYARASLVRRVRQFIETNGFETVSAAIPVVLRDEVVFAELARQFSIAVTEMFRDPFVYEFVRKGVVPLLQTYPSIKVWHAGCATGEEVYSLAILLSEAGIYDRSTIFGTDFNDHSLALARQGIYPAAKMKDYTRNYQLAGGSKSFADYYHARYDSCVMNSALRRRVTFANHNLVCDQVFGEMHLVFCRNVLIYFNRSLQDRALELFTRSLVRGGFLCLGTKEDLRFSSVSDAYEVVDRKARVYRKKFAQ